MAYALDLLVGLLVAVASVPLLMQLKRSNRFVRTLDPLGNLVDPDRIRDFDEVQEEVYVSYMKCDEPEGEGWRRVESESKSAWQMLLVLFGVLLVLAALGLILPWPWPTSYLAWPLFGVSAVMIAIDLPRWPRLFGEDRESPLLVLNSFYAVLGLIAGYRLFY